MTEPISMRLTEALILLILDEQSEYLNKFDVDRYRPDREEHMAPGAYAP